MLWQKLWDNLIEIFTFQSCSLLESKQIYAGSELLLNISRLICHKLIVHCQSHDSPLRPTSSQ